MAQPLGDISVTEQSIADGVVTQVLDTKTARRFLQVQNRSGNDNFFVVYQNATPTGKTQMFQLGDGFQDVYDVLGIPISKVFIFQDSGGPLNIHFAEA